VRFASVYKNFQEIGDFEREFGLLLQKKESKGPLAFITTSCGCHSIRPQDLVGRKFDWLGWGV
jgi:hypothetical protein